MHLAIEISSFICFDHSRGTNFDYWFISYILVQATCVKNRVIMSELVEESTLATASGGVQSIGRSNVTHFLRILIDNYRINLRLKIFYHHVSDNTRTNIPFWKILPLFQSFALQNRVHSEWPCVRGIQSRRRIPYLGGDLHLLIPVQIIFWRLNLLLLQKLLYKLLRRLQNLGDLLVPLRRWWLPWNCTLLYKFGHLR